MNKAAQKFVKKAFIVAAFLAACAAVPALADMMIMPIRTTFVDGDRMKNLTVVNTSDKEGSFRLQFYHMKQVENGGYERLDGPPDPKFDLSKMLVFSPRQVTLPPRGKQAIRLSLRRPADLPDGEYRVHLKLQRANDANPDTPEKGQRTVVGINVGFSVPVMLRKGRYDTTAEIVEPKYKPAEGKLPHRIVFHVNRTGKYSAIGRALVYWAPPSGGEEMLVGTLNGLNVYAETPRREVRVQLSDKSVSGGKIRIRFEGDDVDEGKVFDEKTFNFDDLIR